MTTTCRACGAGNREGARFCTGCGAELAARCPECGHHAEADDRFCGACGHPLGPLAPTAPVRDLGSRPEERKQVTVLFADVKGSMDLAEALDAEDWPGS